MLVGGNSTASDFGRDLKTVIFDLERAQSVCTVEDLPLQLTRSVGDVIGGIPTICGGMKPNGAAPKSCFSLNIETKKWVEHEDVLKNGITEMAGVRLGNKLLITGGKRHAPVSLGREDESLRIIKQGRRMIEMPKFIDVKKRTQKPTVPKADCIEIIEWNKDKTALTSTMSTVKLPEELYGHCVVALDNKLIFVMGGYSKTSNSVSKKTWMINTKTGKVKEEPDMLVGREAFGCHRIGRIVFASGGNNQRSTEYIDLSEKTPMWTKGI